jgi:hypothetical protein
MSLTISIEAVSGNGYVAKIGSPYDCSAQGATIGEAIENLGHETRRQETQSRNAAIIAPPAGGHPLLKWSGTLPDDELTRDWLQTIKENRRRQAEEDERNGVEW